MIVLDKELLKKQRITKQQELTIKRLHREINDLFNIAKVTKDKYKSDLTKRLQELEFELQDNWNFKKDSTKHTYWYKIPGCLCPKMDNKELFGIDKRIINEKCPYHGKVNNDT